jgi:hypothetical protein
LKTLGFLKEFPNRELLADNLNGCSAGPRITVLLEKKALFLHKNTLKEKTVR